MWPIDSSLDESMNEHVLTITTSAFSASGMTDMPAWWRWPTMISLSTRFLAQPREMRLTLMDITKRRPAAGPRAHSEDEWRRPYFFFLAALILALRRFF